MTPTIFYPMRGIIMGSNLIKLDVRKINAVDCTKRLIRIAYPEHKYNLSVKYEDFPTNIIILHKTKHDVIKEINDIEHIRRNIRKYDDKQNKKLQTFIEDSPRNDDLHLIHWPQE